MKKIKLMITSILLSLILIIASGQFINTYADTDTGIGQGDKEKKSTSTPPPTNYDLIIAIVRIVTAGIR